MSRARGNTSRPDIGDFDAEVEFRRNDRRNALELALGFEDQRVLDMAITDASAREIGEAFGYARKRAERQGIRAIEASLEKFEKIAA